MTPSDIVAALVTGVLGIAFLSLIVAPNSQASQVINSLGSNFASVLSAAKAYPAGG